MEWYARLEEIINTLKHLQSFTTLLPADHNELAIAIISLETIMNRRLYATQREQ